MPTANQFTMEDAAALLQSQFAMSQEKQALSMADIIQYASTAGNAVKDMAGQIPTSALVGGGLGLGAGLLGTMSADEKRKHWIRNALLGAGLGAGIGGAWHGGKELYNSLTEPSSVENAAKQQAAATAAAKAAAPPTDPLRALITNAFSSQDTPTNVPSSGTGGTGGTGDTGVTVGTSLVGRLRDLINDNYVKSPVTTIGSTVAGYGSGKAIDKVRDVLKEWRVDGDTVNRLGKDVVSKLPESISKQVKAFQDQVFAAQGEGGKMTSQFGTGLPTITTGKAAPPVTKPAGPAPPVSYPGAPPPNTSSTSPTTTHPGSPSVLQNNQPPIGGPTIAKSIKPVTPGATTSAAPVSTLKSTTPFTPDQWKNTIVPAVREHKPPINPSWAGKAVGTTLGFAGAPAVGWALNRAFGPAPVVPK